MNKTEIWELLERLNDPATPALEKSGLEKKLNQDPVLKHHLETFRILSKWPDLEKEALVSRDEQATLKRLEHEWKLEAVDREMGRVFPFVAAAALAAAVIIGTVNLISMKQSTTDTLQALLGLPHHSLDEMFLAEL